MRQPYCGYGGGTIADGRADGTAEHGIHDVFVFDYRTPLHVIVTFEGGTTYVLQPMLVSIIARRFPAINIPWSWLPVVVPWLNVTRRLDSEGNLVWTRPDQDFVMTLERIGGPNEPYTRLDLPMSTTGGSGLTAGRRGFYLPLTILVTTCAPLLSFSAENLTGSPTLQIVLPQPTVK